MVRSHWGEQLWEAGGISLAGCMFPNRMSVEEQQRTIVTNAP